MIEIAGPRLTLRYATPADAPRLFELGADPAVTQYFSWGPYARVDEAEDYIRALAAQRNRGERLEFVIDDRDAGVIGVTGLSELALRDRRCLVGTWLGRRWWGSGANLESKALIAALAFGPLRMERLTAVAATGNERSQTALERIGFRREGVLEAWHRHGDRVYDMVIYGFGRAAWEASPLSAIPVEITGAPPRRFVAG